VDFARVQRMGWDVVRRPTGGRAILHTDELTYSVSLPQDHELARGDILASYQRLSVALQHGL
jgi:lipoate-protein ligase A